MGARRGRAGAEAQCKSVRARGRAPPREGPGEAAAGGRRAALLLGSGFRGPPRVQPASGVLARAVYLPAIACGGGRGRGQAPGSEPTAPGAPHFLWLAFGFGLAGGGATAPARSPGAIESGLLARELRGSACPAARGLAARRLGGRLGPRPRGRPLRCCAWRPTAGRSAWSGAPGSAERAGRSLGGGSPPAAAPAAAAAPAPRPQPSPGFPRSGCYGDSCAGE